MNTWRGWLAAVLTCAVALALAAAARHWLIEPAAVSARCDAGAADSWCVVRAWTIQLFVHQRIGWAALGLALLAHALRWRGVDVLAGATATGAAAAAAWTALALACAGLVLYTAGLCAPAALLALLAVVRQAGKTEAASPISSRQNARA